MKIHSKIKKSKKNIDLCADKFKDDPYFWRGTRGRRGKIFTN